MTEQENLRIAADQDFEQVIEDYRLTAERVRDGSAPLATVVALLRGAGPRLERLLRRAQAAERALESPLPASVRDEPKVIQIAPLYDPGDARYGPNNELYALRDDGSMWVRPMVGVDNEWREIPAIPTPVLREDS